ncbi:endonuclease domain-containing protein [Micromonospora cathayae]|uniref:DUF559 domain-containing protein n=1 Tax=Micromonospora cathayae TaxID=3028804 RepID=A0ABY7ZIE4_9ACTN|nr:DUF559 domain-containing protein [Micromonospora sp. HUAS 3]WDZ82648.1 DUF559 domain-containing protein [Micromonospora sp. HUAS 3]
MTYAETAPWWTALPAYRVCQLAGVDPDHLELALDPLPADAPAVLRYRPPAGPHPAGQVAALLDATDRAAVALFPHWLPGADRLDGPGTLSVGAARALAAEVASRSRGFGPFLADLAERALRTAAAGHAHPTPPTGHTEAGPTTDHAGTGPTTDLSRPGTTKPLGRSGTTTDRWRAGRTDRARFPAEVRAAGLVRVLAEACDRRSVVLLVRVPDGFTPADEYALSAAAEWFVQHGRCAVWFTGAPLRTVDRLHTVTLPDPPDVTPAPPAPGPAPLDTTPPTPAPARVDPARPAAGTVGAAPAPPGPGAVDASGGAVRPPVGASGPAEPPSLRVPPRSGLPRADSAAEQTLERALARHGWAGGRHWNHTLTWHTLARPYRLDLFWPAEGLVVEVDGPEHRERVRYADDRHRDAQLQLLGHDVLRFTNDQVLTDVDAVVGTIRDLLAGRRAAGVRYEGTRHHVDR